VGVRAAFFDVGDTLAEGWAEDETLRRIIRADLVAAFGERDWYDALAGADIVPPEREMYRQETRGGRSPVRVAADRVASVAARCAP